MSVGGIRPGSTSDVPTPAVTPQAAAHDEAIAKAFGAGAAATLASGAKGQKVVAVQYALGRLGFLTSLADGSYGPKTVAAVKAFQAKQGLPETGTVDARTLAALDAAAAAHDPRPPAAKAASAIGYFSDWSKLGLSKIEIKDRSKPINWKNAEVQAAYGKFVGEYWGVLKENHVEADCKTLALFFMDQFRSKLKADTGAQLALPGSSEGRVAKGTWTAATASRTGGFMSRFSQLAQVRPGYAAAQKIQELDSKHSMVQGVNLRYAGVDADAAARAATTVAAWDPRLDNRGDQTRPEVPTKDLRPGDVIFIDHTGDGKWDHTVNVVGVERDAAGVPKKLTLAVGSFDDMKDADGKTAPNGLGEVNNYAEELEVTLDASGKITGSKVTWSSEPAYLVDARYSARTTLMELKPGGRLKVARWSDPG
jgi:hypothetical protein